MKKAILTFFLMTLIILSNAQAIEIIDAIAGKLLPGITSGVKEIIDRRGKNNQKHRAKNEIDSIIKIAQKELISSLDKEIDNINIIRTIFTESRKANSAAGAVKALTNRSLLSFMKGTDNIEAKKQTVLLFIQEWNSLNSSLTTIKNVHVSSLDPNLQQNLTQEKDKIQDALQRITTINGFTSGTIVVNGSLTVDDANSRIIAIENATEHINRIQDAVENIARLVDTRLQTYKLSFERLKTQISS